MLLTWIFAASFFAVVAGDTSSYIFCVTAGGTWIDSTTAKGSPTCKGYNARFESKTKKEAEDACAYKVPFDVVGVQTGWPTLCDFEVRATCPDGYIQLNHECFRATSVLIYQHQARAACKNLTGVDGTLLKLTSSRLQRDIYAAFTNLHGLWLDVDGRRNKNGELESSLDVLYKWKRPRNTINTGGSNETHQLMAITQAGVWEVGAHRILYDVSNSVKAMAICKFKPTPSMRSFEETSDVLNSIGIDSNVYHKMMLISFPSMFRYERDPQNNDQIVPEELHEKCKKLCESFGMPCYAAVPNAKNAKDMLDFMRKNDIKYALTPILRSTVPSATRDCSHNGGGAARSQFSGIDPLQAAGHLCLPNDGPGRACEVAGGREVDGPALAQACANRTRHRRRPSSGQLLEKKGTQRRLLGYSACRSYFSIESSSSVDATDHQIGRGPVGVRQDPGENQEISFTWFEPKIGSNMEPSESGSVKEPRPGVSLTDQSWNSEVNFVEIRVLGNESGKDKEVCQPEEKPVEVSSNKLKPLVMPISDTRRLANRKCNPELARCMSP
ncbi:unnamed protein product [Caenorhabditis auriculariae]|uniref:C-type lectin domain-containing protein n=1 Tax=Caenorhabditis auriculariae TaxID=2777116 RepID=A0A8S1HW17_9PELO|nr:unnamed protein product [Caenorhabditis auriculariae]